MSSSATTQSYGRLKGKVAIVTGASSPQGFGFGIAEAYVREGATVINADFASPHPDATLNGAITYHKMDVTSRQAWDDLFTFTKTTYGGIDILVNNAGWSYKNKPTTEVTDEEFDRVFDINVKGIFYSMQSLITIMLPSKDRLISVVNIASIGAHRPRGGLVWYNASKAAVLNATKGLAAEYASVGIRVNGILPLLSATALFEQFTGEALGDNPEEVKKRFTSVVPMGRLCEKEDVAGCALWLASDEAKFITGQGIEVDGGKCIS